MRQRHISSFREGEKERRGEIAAERGDMAQPGRSPEVDAELKKLQGVQNGERPATWRYWILPYSNILYESTILFVGP